MTESLRTADVLIDCVRSCEMSPSQRSGPERLRSLGRHLIAIGSLELRDFEETLRRQQWRWAVAYAAALETLLHAHGHSPSYWADDVKRTLQALRHVLPTAEYVVPRDLLAGRDLDTARTLTRRLVLQFGQLLEAWPDIVEAAKHLRANGRRVARPIGRS